MKKLLLAGLLLMGSTAFAAHVSIGINIGGPYGYYPPPPPRVAYVAAPGPGYVWVDGFYYPARSGWQWRAGYWSRPPYVGAYWVRPRYEGRRYYEGYWAGRRGNGRGYAYGHR